MTKTVTRGNEHGRKHFSEKRVAASGRGNLLGYMRSDNGSGILLSLSGKAERMRICGGVR